MNWEKLRSPARATFKNSKTKNPNIQEDRDQGLPHLKLNMMNEILYLLKLQEFIDQLEKRYFHWEK